jgi:predicted DNA-binding transcriptional regulator AlpA
VSISIATASRWPSRAAYFSAAIFTAARGTMNVAYGWQRGTDLASCLVWAAVAGAVAIVFALSWPALIRSLDARRWSAAVMAFAALLIAGAYSVSAALGSAAGGRMYAAATETASTDARQRAQRAYAQYVGISPTKFDQMVADGRMPSPKRINSRTVWDRHQLDAAFAALPNQKGEQDDE